MQTLDITLPFMLFRERKTGMMEKVFHFIILKYMCLCVSACIFQYLSACERMHHADLYTHSGLCMCLRACLYAAWDGDRERERDRAKNSFDVEIVGQKLYWLSIVC